VSATLDAWLTSVDEVLDGNRAQMHALRLDRAFGPEHADQAPVRPVAPSVMPPALTMQEYERGRRAFMRREREARRRSLADLARAFRS
jgi:hypothetical protein